MDRLAVEFICAFGMPPVEFIRMVAGLGLGQIGLAPSPITDNPHGYPAWDLRTDANLVREVKAALADSGVRIAQGEGFLIMPGMEIAATEAQLDLFAELGAPMVNCVTLEQDRPRAQAQFAALAEMAAARGMNVSVEFMPLMWPATLAEAQDFVRGSGAANGRLMVDAMHFYRSGAQTADLAAIDPALIAYVQICDAPMAGIACPPGPEAMAAYGEEARHERMCPGDGELPLADFLRALPRGVPVGLEIPILSKARAGVAPVDAIRPCVAAARALLA